MRPRAASFLVHFPPFRVHARVTDIRLRVPGPRPPSRNRVRVLRVETKQAGDPYVELSVEGAAPHKSKPAPKGKFSEHESHFSFFVGNPSAATLKVEAFVRQSSAKVLDMAANMAGVDISPGPKAARSRSSLVGVSVGTVDVPVAKFMWTKGQPFPAAQWYDLGGGSRVRLQLLMIRSPKAESKGAVDGFGGGHTLNVLVGTWNVGNERPPTDLSRWLNVGVNQSDATTSAPAPTDSAPGKKDKQKKDEHATGIAAPNSDSTDGVPTAFGTYEMVVVGCQEGDYKPRSPHDNCEDDWFAGISATLGDSYVMHCKNTLGQMRVAAFVRADIAPAVHHWQKSTEATGIGHVLSNKGGVGIACRVWDTSVCFLNSHLAAHDDQYQRRNDDFAEIVGGCKFGEKLECTQAFHHLVWMGDLNYRCNWGMAGGDGKVDRSPSKDRVKRMIAALGVDDVAGRKEVFKTDQLTEARIAGDAFLDFNEGDPAEAHMPTFKVLRQPGFHYKEQRTPAWCDRVLWKTAEGIGCEQTLLAAAGEIATSDHKPVAAGLAMELIAHPATVHFEDDIEPVASVTSVEDVKVSVEGSSGNPISPSGKRAVLTHAHGHHHLKPSPSLFQTIFGSCCCGSNADGPGAAASEWVLRFASLSASDLISADINGSSDPYVVFLGPLLVPPTQQSTFLRKIGAPGRWATSTVVRNLNPTWKCPDQVPILPLISADAEVIRREYLSFRVMDEDTLSQDDPIGYGRLFLGPLGDAMAAGKEATLETTVMLTCQGRRAGELKLRVALEKA